MKVYSKIDKKIGILGQNILINERQITAFYIIDSVNYSTLNKTGIRSHIGRMETLLSTLSIMKPNFSFSLLQVEKVLTPEDIKNNLIDTIRLWDPDYKDIPNIFKDHITKSKETFTLLACNIDTKDLGDIESVSIKDLAKGYISGITQEFLSTKQINVDTKKIMDIEKQLNDVICRYGVRASRELVFYTYISSLYPSYEISYDTNSYISNNMSPILGAVSQEIESHFGYFTMMNSGVEMFGLPAQKTYGCILNIRRFPNMIDSNNFKLNIHNLRLNIRTIPKERAKILIKRLRADMEFEEETAMDADARVDRELQENQNMAEIALNNIAKGSTLCEMEASILLLSRDLSKLKSERQKMITTLADIDTIASISFDQGLDFINNYVKLKPTKYSHLCELIYPLSFQIDNNVNLGDFDSKYMSPAIGTGI